MVLIIAMREHLHVTEGEEGRESQGCATVGLKERVALQHPIGVVAEEELLLQYHASDTIGRRGGDVDIVLSDVLVPLGAEDIALILVDTDVERHAMLHDRQIEAGEQYVVVLTEFGDGDDEDAVVLACVTAYDAGAAIGALAVGTYVLPLGGLIEVGHESAVELEVTHAKCRFIVVRLRTIIGLIEEAHSCEVVYNSPAKLRISDCFAKSSSSRR